MPKKTLQGGHDAKAMQKKAVEARKRNAAMKAQAVHEKYRHIPLEELGPSVLRELVSDVKTPASVRAQAAKYLADLPVEDDDGGWRSSVQVRSDYEPPSWDEVLLVAKDAGAV